MYSSDFVDTPRYLVCVLITTYEVQARRRRWRLSRKHFSKFFHMPFHKNINNVRGWRLAFNVHAPQISDYHYSVKR